MKSDSSADSYDDDDEADNKTIYEVNIFERDEVDNEGKPVYKDIKVLWLPTKHCHLNPIEMVWAWIKVNCTLRSFSQFKISITNQSNGF